jgi:transposase-like protein
MDPFLAGAAGEAGKELAHKAIEQMTQCPNCHEKINIGTRGDAAWTCPRCSYQFTERERRRLGGR